jgi:uncharacterized membrane protein YqjE
LIKRTDTEEVMNAEKHAPRLLGAMFLVVIVTSAVGGALRSAAVGTGDISATLVHIANQPELARMSMLAHMLNSLGVVALAALLYIVLRTQHRIIALIALGWWLLEAGFGALGEIGTLALIRLSLEFVSAGAPAQSSYQMLGAFLYEGFVEQSMALHMFFYCAGGILWYSLFYHSRYVPRLLALYGVIVATVGLAGIVLELLGNEVPILVYLPILPFELIIGFWLLLRGIAEPESPPTQSPQADPGYGGVA